MISLHPCWDGYQWKTTDSSIRVMLKVTSLTSGIEKCSFLHCLNASYHTDTGTINTGQSMTYDFFISCLAKIKHHVPHIFSTVLTMFCVGGKKPLNIINKSLHIKTHNKRENQPYIFYLLLYSDTGDTTAPDIWACMARAHKFSRNQASTSKF